MPKAKERTRASDALDLLLAQRTGKRAEIARKLRREMDRSVLNRARIGERHPSDRTQDKIRKLTGGLIPVIWWQQPARGPKRCGACGRSCACACGRAA